MSSLWLLLGMLGYIGLAKGLDEFAECSADLCYTGVVLNCTIGDNCRVDCTTLGACTNTTVNCAVDCTVFCSGTASCEQLTVNSIDGSEVAVECSAVDSCKGTQIFKGDGTVNGVRCQSANSCRDLELDCGNTPADCLIGCDRKYIGACFGAMAYCHYAYPQECGHGCLFAKTEQCALKVELVPPPGSNGTVVIAETLLIDGTTIIMGNLTLLPNSTLVIAVHNGSVLVVNGCVTAQGGTLVIDLNATGGSFSDGTEVDVLQSQCYSGSFSEVNVIGVRDSCRQVAGTQQVDGTSVNVLLSVEQVEEGGCSQGDDDDYVTTYLAAAGGAGGAVCLLLACMAVAFCMVIILVVGALGSAIATLQAKRHAARSNMVHFSGDENPDMVTLREG